MTNTLATILPARWRSGSDSKTTPFRKAEHDAGTMLEHDWTGHWTDYDSSNPVNQIQNFDSPRSDTTLVNSSPELDQVNKKEKSFYDANIGQQHKKRGEITITIPLPWPKRSQRRRSSNSSPVVEPIHARRGKVTSPLDGVPAPHRSPPVPNSELETSYPETSSTKIRSPPTQNQPVMPSYSSASYTPQLSLLSALSPVSEDFEKRARSPGLATSSAAADGNRNSDFSGVQTTSSINEQLTAKARARSNSRGPAAGLNLYADRSGTNFVMMTGRVVTTSVYSAADDDEDDDISTDPNSRTSSRASSRARSSSRNPFADRSRESSTHECNTPRGRSNIRASSKAREGSKSRSRLRQHSEARQCNISLPLSRTSSCCPETARAMKTPTLKDTTFMRSSSQASAHRSFFPANGNGIPPRTGHQTQINIDRSRDLHSRRAASREPISRREWSREPINRRAVSTDPIIRQPMASMIAPHQSTPLIFPPRVSTTKQQQQQEQQDENTYPQSKENRGSISSLNAFSSDGETQYDSSDNEWKMREPRRFSADPLRTFEPLSAPRQHRFWNDSEPMSGKGIYDQTSTEYRKIGQNLESEYLQGLLSLGKEPQYQQHVTSPGVFAGTNPLSPQAAAATVQKIKKKGWNKALVPDGDDLWG